MSLKTKGFSRETEAFLDDGGGEIRTLVLSKLHSNDYMLSASFYSMSFAGKHVTLSSHTPYNLEFTLLGIQESSSHQENMTMTN